MKIIYEVFWAEKCNLTLKIIRKNGVIDKRITADSLDECIEQAAELLGMDVSVIEAAIMEDWHDQQ